MNSLARKARATPAATTATGGAITAQPKRDHAAIGRQYCQDIVEGKVAANRLVILACKRQLDDLARAESGDPDFPYFFDEAKANHACRFIELLPHIKGKWARRVPGRSNLIRFEPWQSFAVGTLYGWYRLPATEGEPPLRRFREAYWELPRKNSKSTMAAGVSLYALAADGEPGAEVYSAATKRDQARIVFNVAKSMARRTPKFRARLGVFVRAAKLEVRISDSSFEPLAADAKGLDGLSPHLSVIDELHAHKDRRVYDALNLGMGAREQPILLSITTAGDDESGICYELHSYGHDLLEGIVDRNESFFVLIYGIDIEDRDRWNDPVVWAKANPNYGVSVFANDLEGLAAKAAAEPAAKQGFLTKRLNVWSAIGTRVIDGADWDACADPTLRLEDFEGEKCVIGIDLATRDDLAAVCLLFPAWPKLYAFWRYYLPEKTIKDKRNASYPSWHEKGFIASTPGAIIDMDQIRDEIAGVAADDIRNQPRRLGDLDRFDVEAVAYDPWQATHLATQLAAGGAEMVEVRMITANLTEPMKDILAEIKAGQLVHGGDPVTKWNASNLMAKPDANDNIFPRKPQPAKKIDGLVAAILAHSRLHMPVKRPSVYENRTPIWG